MASYDDVPPPGTIRYTGTIISGPETVGEKLYRLEREVERLKADNEDKNKQITAMGRDLKLAEKHRDESNRELKRLWDELKSMGCRCGYVAKGNPGNCVCIPQTDDEAREVTDVPDVYVRLSTAALGAFAEGYREYGPGAADELGLAGQWGDLHRKVMKLKRALWEGHPGYLTREAEEDILKDIIGHCLLALEMMERGFGAGRS